MRHPAYRTIEGCNIEIPSPCAIVIFGAHGDLAKRKLIPSLYRLHKNRLVSENFFILGCGRINMDRSKFLEMIGMEIKNAIPNEFDNSSWDEFSQRLYYSSIDFTVTESYTASLIEKLPALEKKHQTMGNRIFYLATPSSVFETVIINLGGSGLSVEREGYTYIIIEKPFGRDIESAKRLNKVLRE